MNPAQRRHRILNSGLDPARYFAACALLAAVFSAQAAPVVYQGVDNANLSGGGAHPLADAAEAAFAGAATLSVVDFESFATGTLPASVDFGSITAALSSSATDSTAIASVNGGFDTYAASGTQFLFSLSAAGTTYFTFDFSAPVAGFGFHLIDASDWASDSRPADSLIINLFRAGGTTSLELFGDVPANVLVSGNFGYFGILDAADPFLGFSISGAAINPDSDALGLDDLAIAPVPLPAGAWLFGTGLAMLAARRRR